jgi:hypothetical protein
MDAGNASLAGLALSLAGSGKQGQNIGGNER